MYWFNRKRLEWSLRFWKFRRVCKQLRLMLLSRSKEMRKAIRVFTRAGMRRFARVQVWTISRRKLNEMESFRLELPCDLSSFEIVETPERNFFIREFDDMTIIDSPHPDQCFPMNTFLVPDIIETASEDGFFSSTRCQRENPAFSHADNSSQDSSLKPNKPQLLGLPKLRRAVSCKEGTRSGSRSPGLPRRRAVSRTPTTTNGSAEYQKQRRHSGLLKYFPVRRHSESSLTSSSSTRPHSTSISSDSSSSSDDRSSPSPSDKSSKYSEATHLSTQFTRIDDDDSVVLIKKNSVLEFIFEDPPSQSSLLRTQALQNILECPSCRSIVNSKNDGPSSSPDSLDQYISHQDYFRKDGSKCLLCECSYGETKNLLLEKLTAAKWFRPCRYQSYGCQSLVGQSLSSDVQHNEDECKFQPLHCPFMLCPKKFQAPLLLTHLTQQHNLRPHAGPQSEGTISFLSRNKRLGSLRPDYALDPCLLLCYDHIFVFRLLRHSSAWYFWVWSFQASQISPSSSPPPPPSSRHYPKGNSASRSTHFPFTVHFQRRGFTDNNNDEISSSDDAELTIKGSTVPLTVPAQELIEKRLCQIIPEAGSIFEAGTDDYGSCVAVEYSLTIHPPTLHRSHSHNHHRRRLHSTVSQAQY